MPVSSDLIGNRGTFFFLSAMKFNYIPFPFSSFVIVFEKQISLKKKICVLSHMFMVEGGVGRTELEGQEVYLNFVDFT